MVTPMTRTPAEIRDHLDLLRAMFQHWADWNRDRRAEEGLATEDNTHVYVAPPHWPTHAALKAWAATMTEAADALAPLAAERGAETNDLLNWIDSLPKEPTPALRAAFEKYKDVFASEFDPAPPAPAAMPGVEATRIKDWLLERNLEYLAAQSANERIMVRKSGDTEMFLDAAVLLVELAQENEGLKAELASTRDSYEQAAVDVIALLHAAEADRGHWLREARRLLKAGQEAVDKMEAAEARALSAEQALATIIAKHAEWRKCMPADWEGDPLSAAIDAAAIRSGET